MGVVEESDVEDDERTVGLQETYNSLLKKSGEYARVAKVDIKKMKKAEEDYRSLLVQYKETKCEMETLNGELIETYSKIKFLELEVIQANAKVERVSSKKLNEVLAHQKPFSNKSGLGYMNIRRPSKPNLPSAPKPSKLFPLIGLHRTLSSLTYRIPQSPIASTKMN